MSYYYVDSVLYSMCLWIVVMYHHKIYDINVYLYWSQCTTCLLLFYLRCKKPRLWLIHNSLKAILTHTHIYKQKKKSHLRPTSIFESKDIIIVISKNIFKSICWSPSWISANYLCLFCLVAFMTHSCNCVKKIKIYFRVKTIRISAMTIVESELW